MNDQLLEGLLHEEEGGSLDFKRDQYLFAGATDDEKAEMLKDILAFANAWRRDTAYVLRGVQEVRGGRSIPVGVSHHLNDNDLQQFVNSKTNRPIFFRYMAYPFEGVQLGIIEIPVQQRPFYLTKSYGTLTKEVVYLRRGSSTAIASPAEIADMGAADAAPAVQAPLLEIEWGEPESRRLLGSTTRLDVEVLAPRLASHLVAPVSPQVLFGQGDPDAGYRRQLLDFAFEASLMRPLHVVVHNRGQDAARAVTIQAVLPKAADVRLSEALPERPSSLLHGSMPSLGRLRSPFRTAVPDVDDHADHWSLKITFGAVLPGQTVWSDQPIYLGASVPQRITLPIRVLAENLPRPVECELSADVFTTTRPMELKDCKRRD